MGRQGSLDQHRRKGPVGSGRRRKQERGQRKRAAKDAQQTMAALHLERKRQEGPSAATLRLQKRKKNKKRRQDAEELSDGEKEQGGAQEEGEAEAEPEAKGSKSTGYERGFCPSEAAHAEVPFERCFWLARKPPPDEEPDQDLKLQRKALGVRVKGAAIPPPVASLADEGLPPVFGQLQEAAKRKGSGIPIKEPTPIQAQVWPAALCGFDVIGVAPTGSGKTLAYILPAVPHVMGQAAAQQDAGKKALTCLVLVPTRELARQVADVCGAGSSSAWLKRLFGLRAGAVYGGIGKEVQLDSLITLGVPQILAATPGRLLDLLGLAVLSLESVTYLVLDEADRMLALGFEAQVTAIVKGMRCNRQVLLFSATFPLKLQTAAEGWMSQERVLVRVATMELAGGQSIAESAENEKRNEDASDGGEAEGDGEEAEEEGEEEGLEGDDAAAETKPKPAAAGSKHEAHGASTLTVSPTVHQTVHVCAEHKKLRKLAKYLTKMREEERTSGVRQRAAVLIFCTQIKTLRAVEKFVHKAGERSAPLHSGIPQVKREQALEDLKVGKVDTLVATDVASRGLHVSRLKYVVNYDFPSNLELYCHRIGRVGRQGAEGWAYSFFTRNLVPLAPGLLSLLERAGQAVDPNLRALAEGKPLSAAQDDAEDGDASGKEEEAPGAAAKSQASQKKQKRQRPSKAAAAPPAAGAGAAASGSPAAFKPGVAVLLHGLRGAVDLNGKEAVIRSKDAATGRWEVVLKGGVVKSVKEENLSHAQGDTGGRAPPGPAPAPAPPSAPRKRAASDADGAASSAESEAGGPVGPGGGLRIRPAKRRKRGAGDEDASSSDADGGAEAGAAVEPAAQGAGSADAAALSRRQKERKRQKRKQAGRHR